MTIGPVQLLVLGFDRPGFGGRIREELRRLHGRDLVRVVDALTVYKAADGSVSVTEESQLTEAEAEEFGATVGALIGLGAAGERGMRIGAELGAAAAAEGGGVWDPEQAWDVLSEIPEDTAAALILLEHRWAIPLRHAIRESGGFRLVSEFVNPLDLVGVGLLGSEEAKHLVATGSDAM